MDVEKVSKGVSTNSNPTGTVSDHHEGTDEERSEDSLLHDARLNVYPCELCDYKATSIKALNEHYQRKNVQGEMFQTVQSKNKTPRSKKKHACPYCDYRSNLVGHVKRHILIHTGETPFECTHCDYKCRDKTTLRRHIERHVRVDCRSPKYYQCRKCNFITSFKGALSRHLLRHKEPIICQHCSAHFWKEKSYKNHILLHAGVALYPCRSCDYKTNVAGDLTNHMKRMHSDKSWICSECNYSTSCPSDLSKHKIIHKSDRPYACDQCDYTGKRPSHLKVHLATHNRTLKNYACPFCNYRTMMIGTLRIHVRSHTGEKPYICKVCGCAYTSRAGARAHEYTHIKDWSQSCPHCDFKASKPHLFRRHLKTHVTLPATLSAQKLTSSRSTSTQTSKENTNLKRNKKVALETKAIPAVYNEEKDPFNESRPVEPSSSLPQSSPNDYLTLFNDFKTDPDEVSSKTEPEFIPSHVEEPVKAEDIDIYYPVKEECETL